jgi:hypothetical protein
MRVTTIEHRANQSAASNEGTMLRVEPGHVDGLERAWFISDGVVAQLAPCVVEEGPAGWAVAGIAVAAAWTIALINPLWRPLNTRDVRTRKHTTLIWIARRPTHAMPSIDLGDGPTAATAIAGNGPTDATLHATPTLIPPPPITNKPSPLEPIDPARFSHTITVRDLAPHITSLPGIAVCTIALIFHPWRDRHTRKAPNS